MFETEQDLQCLILMQIVYSNTNRCPRRLRNGSHQQQAGGTDARLPPASPQLPPADSAACQSPTSRLRAPASRLRSSRLPPRSENEAPACLPPRASKLPPEAGASAAGKTELLPASRLSQAAEASAWGRRLPGAGSWICHQAGVWPQRIANFSSGCRN